MFKRPPLPGSIPAGEAYFSGDAVVLEADFISPDVVPSVTQPPSDGSSATCEVTIENHLPGTLYDTEGNALEGSTGGDCAEIVTTWPYRRLITVYTYGGGDGPASSKSVWKDAWLNTCTTVVCPC